MVKEKKQLAEAILNHALEIICFLTVEDFIVVKETHDGTQCTFSIRATEMNSNILDSPSGYPELFFTLQRLENKTQKMIAKLANKIVCLLNGEVPVTYEDVVVPSSNDDCEYLEQDNLYTNNEDLGTAERSTSPLQQSTEERYPIKYFIKEEPEEEPPHVAENSTSKDKDSSAPITEDKQARTSKSKSGYTTFNCEECGRAFSSKFSLKRHLQRHNPGQPEKRFSYSNHLTTHRSCFGKKSHVCKHCGQSFLSGRALIRHRIVHAPEKPFSCPVCGKGFTRLSSLGRHSGLHAEKKPFVCSQCGKGYCQNASLVLHLRVHSGEKPFVCQHCDEAFACKARMLKHQQTHTAEKPFPCPQCKERFNNFSALSRHQRAVHGTSITKIKESDNKPAEEYKPIPRKLSPPCEVCGKVFVNKSTLNKHMRLHMDPCPYPLTCSQCDQTFLNRTKLRAHETTHSGDRPFACILCGQRFLRHQHLVDHQVVHTGEKRFSCPMCRKAFTRKFNLKLHIAVHAKIKPLVCNKGGKSNSLVAHQQAPSAKKQFVCKHCEKAFIYMTALLKHERSHLGGKPHSCPHCEKSFAAKSSLRKHKRKAHAKEAKPT